ncbi:hypothetical protein C8R44DRAFT_876964 [Mycena epipterygia]|nr:hypothetical protein C8R44DRAFT_876964 [Mycena epipterygia]
MEQQPVVQDYASSKNRFVSRAVVKITAWRILNTVVLLTLGIYKAVTTYLGQAPASTLDWIIGVVWALISYWASLVEQENPTIAPWFFDEDLSSDLHTVVARVSKGLGGIILIAGK